MTVKNDGRERKSKLKEQKYGKGKSIICKNCKAEYDSLDIQDDIFKIGKKTFIQCEECNEQIKLK